MTSCDNIGRPYAKLPEIKVGDVLEADDGFTCLAKGDQCPVEQDGDGLFVKCSDGTHHLSGQADDGVHVAGFYPVKPAE